LSKGPFVQRCVVVLLAVSVTLDAGEGYADGAIKRGQEDPTPFELMEARHDSLRDEGKLVYIGVGDTAIKSNMRAIVGLLTMLGAEQKKQGGKVVARYSQRDLLTGTVIEHALGKFPLAVLINTTNQAFSAAMHTTMQVCMVSVSDPFREQVVNFNDVEIFMDDFRIHASSKEVNIRNLEECVYMSQLRIMRKTDIVAVFVDGDFHLAKLDNSPVFAHHGFWDTIVSGNSNDVIPGKKGDAMDASLKNLLADHGFITRMENKDDTSHKDTVYYHLVEFDVKKLLTLGSARAENAYQELNEAIKKMNEKSKADGNADKPTP